MQNPQNPFQQSAGVTQGVHVASAVVAPGTLPGMIPIPPQAMPGTEENKKLVEVTFKAIGKVKEWINSRMENKIDSDSLPTESQDLVKQFAAKTQDQRNLIKSHLQRELADTVTGVDDAKIAYMITRIEAIDAANVQVNEDRFESHKPCFNDSAKYGTSGKECNKLVGGKRHIGKITSTETPVNQPGTGLHILKGGDTQRNDVLRQQPGGFEQLDHTINSTEGISTPDFDRSPYLSVSKHSANEPLPSTSTQVIKQDGVFEDSRFAENYRLLRELAKYEENNGGIFADDGYLNTSNPDSQSLAIIKETLQDAYYDAIEDPESYLSQLAKHPAGKARVDKLEAYLNSSSADRVVQYLSEHPETLTVKGEVVWNIREALTHQHLSWENNGRGDITGRTCL